MLNFVILNKMIRALKALTLLFVACKLTGCHTDMWKQAKVNPFQESSLFPDNQSARHPVEGTIARGNAKLNRSFYTGYENGKLIKEFPLPLTAKLLKHGKERFHIFCTPCHGEAGYGNGMIAQRGLDFKKPASYHTNRLRTISIGHFYDVMTNGYGMMIGFKDKLSAEDRWAIVAYIRALQLSQNAKAQDLKAQDQQKLLESLTQK